MLEVAEETGLSISNPEHMARYAGSVAAHEIFLAQAEGGQFPTAKRYRTLSGGNGSPDLTFRSTSALSKPLLATGYPEAGHLLHP